MAQAGIESKNLSGGLVTLRAVLGQDAEEIIVK